ncbi:HD domain-containing protein [Candidatus Phytoplasma fraxini]|uniref:3'->5' exoribonuclease Bsu YhaM n=1 Tax=Ash yellows phytoplasma TaxID=35780 RepID=A0ABZ2U7Y3_ASHYP
MNQNLFLQNKKINDKITFIGKIISLNKGEHFCNIDFLLMENFNVNIKIDSVFDIPQKDKLYVFETAYQQNKNNKNVLICLKYSLIENNLNLEQIYHCYNHFFTCTNIPFHVIDQQITNFLSNIKNPIFKKITQNIYSKYKINFLISPAACKMHHAYYGGLSHHTLSILKISNHYLELYPFLNKDLLQCGIILHDMAKIQEFTFETKSYTKQGVLLGHLILGVNNIHEEALLLGFQDKEEILLLKHLIIAHHGLLQYGAFKEPQIGEALLLWYLDDLDAKLNTLKEEIEKTEKGKFTENLPVIKGKSFYKPDL